MDKMPLLGIEIDGYAFHNENAAQTRRDELKNAILAKYNFTLLRLNTTQSGEEKRIINALEKIVFKNSLNFCPHFIKNLNSVQLSWNKIQTNSLKFEPF